MAKADESDNEIVECFQEFCEETSLGGFKYLLEQYGPLARRLCWLVILMVFTGVTLYQLFTQIQGYVDNPLVVNQETQFPNNLDFPTIVLCNTMPYRVSAVKPASAMHEALFNLYSTPTINVSAAHEYIDVLSSVKNVGQYFDRIAAQKHDLILNCTFDGEPDLCNVATDFNAMLTPYGTCYAFNSNTNRNYSRIVSNGGPMHGLEVVMNAETYEAMHGPYTDFGVKIIIFPFGVPRFERFTTAGLGLYNTVSMNYAETKFLKGVTCGWKQLKYFNFYERGTCIFEKAIDQVIHNCSCIPHVVDERVWPHELNLPACNLGMYYVCSQPIMESFDYVSEEICPKHCSNYDYRPSISQSTVAWDRLESYSRVNVSLVEHNLLRARDVTIRYIPTHNETMEIVFKTVRNATEDTKELIDYVNKVIRCDFPPMPAIAVTPSYLSSDSIDKTIDTDIPRFKLNIKKMFHNLNSSINLLSSLVQNETWINYLNLTNVDDEMEDQLFALNNIFSVTDRSVYLSYIIQWSKTLDSLAIDKSTSESNELDPDKRGKSDDGMSIFNASFYIASGKTALSTNDTELLNEMVAAFRDIKLNYLSDINCWNIRIPQPFQADGTESIDTESASVDYVNQTLQISYPDGPPRLFDMITCLLVNFAEESILNTLATRLVSTVSIFRVTDVNAHNQQKRCNQFLCEYLGIRNDGKSCEISINSWVGALTLSIEWASTAFDLCYLKGEYAVEKLDAFVSILTDNVLPEFTSEVSNMTQFIHGVAEIQAILGSQLIINTTFPEMDNEINLYLDRNTTYKNLSEFVVNTLYPFSTNIFSVNMQSALKLLNELSQELDIAEGSLNNLYDENSNTVKPIFQILTKAMLGWRNETVVRENAETILNCIGELRNVTLSVIDILPKVKDNYTQIVNAWHLHAENFLKELTIDQTFFSDNFLVINVCFDEISIQQTTQSSAYDFWSLMSDIGGASGLWLGFSCICLVEFVDLAIRRCCIGAYKYSTRRRRKQTDKKSPTVHDMQNLNGIMVEAR